VAKVVAVRKFHPARLKVDLEYRRPVLMVEVPGGLLPVDVQGAWLPSGDFSPIEAAGYPRLVGINSVPVGPVGTRWGDARVLGAAEIAAAIGSSNWTSLKLQRIMASTPWITNAGEEFTYEITTRGGTRVLWGRSPGASSPGEVPAADKVARLKQYAAEHSGLDGPHGPQVLDVRSLRRLEVRPAETKPTPAAG
jgi:cell division septal protein FtsQ